MTPLAAIMLPVVTGLSVALGAMPAFDDQLHALEARVVVDLDEPDPRGIAARCAPNRNPKALFALAYRQANLARGLPAYDLVVYSMMKRNCIDCGG